MRILIAEDDMVSRRLLQATLQKWEHEPVVTADGEAAWIELTKSDAPRIAILDWMMPGMDGPEVCRRFRELPGSESTYIILLTAKGGKDDIVEGLEAGADDYMSKPFNRDELHARLNVAARIVELQQALNDQIQELERVNQRLKEMSSQDGLTGIPNRRFFDEEADRAWRRAMREDIPVSLILMDIDFFKKFNDNYGHVAGDDCLVAVAQVLSETARRGGDFVARYGGEEFGALLAGTDAEGAVALAEKMRDAVEALDIEHLWSDVAKHVTISLGVASQVPSRDMTVLELIQTADRGLYKAKESGRNQVAVAE